jgi:RNA polymerase sigma-70 factor (ECF subfamily)
VTRTDPPELDDLTLARARLGEPAACRALVLRYQGPVFALLSRLLGGRDRGLVEDLAQETFLRTFRALPSWDRQGSARLSTWILTVGTRLALDELRRRRPELAPIEDATSHAADPHGPEDAAHRRDLASAIQRAMDALPADFRAAFVLREFHELDYAEIARALDVDVGTVKSRLSRARAALRTALSEVCDD